jgi:hypothetical protein
MERKSRLRIGRRCTHQGFVRSVRRRRGDVLRRRRPGLAEANLISERGAGAKSNE